MHGLAKYEKGAYFPRDVSHDVPLHFEEQACDSQTAPKNQPLGRAEKCRLTLASSCVPGNVQVLVTNGPEGPGTDDGNHHTSHEVVDSVVIVS